MRLTDNATQNRSATATAKGRVSGLAHQRQKAALSAQEHPDPHIIRGIVTDQTGRLAAATTANSASPATPWDQRAPQIPIGCYRHPAGQTSSFLKHPLSGSAPSPRLAGVQET